METPFPPQTLTELARVLARPRSENRAGRAAVIGATIAFGSCTLACSDGSGLELKVPALNATSPSADDEIDEGLASPALDALEGRFGALEASPGFLPDPLTRTGTTAGGPLRASDWDEGCEGWVAAEPDYVIEAERPFAELALMVASEEDATLMLVGPDGAVRCAAGGDGPHPVLRAAFERGLHRVWVGTHERDATAAYVLALSELDDMRPSRLLH